MEAPKDVHERILGQLRGLVETALGGECKTIDQGEQLALGFGREAAKVLLAAFAERWGTGHVGRLHRASDGTVREFHRHGAREVQTVAGSVKLRRAYYRDTAGGGQGVFPLDLRLGLNSRGVTPAFAEVVAELGAWVPFEKAAQFVKRLTGIGLGEQTVRRITEEVGKELIDWQADEGEIALERPIAIPHEIAHERVAVGVDGVHVHVDGDWHEVKLGTVYHFDSSGEQLPGTKRHVARIGPPERLKGPLALEAARVGGFEASELVALGDGAPWIWNLFDELLPGATQVLDCYHALGHVHEVAKARFGSDSKRSRPWTKMVHQRLLHDGIDWFVEHLSQIVRDVGPPDDATDDNDPRATLARALGYFRTNRARMRYGTFRARGLPIGSGVVEAACKALVAERLKAPGMRWSQAGAEQVLAVRGPALTDLLAERLRQRRVYARAA